LPGFDDFIKVWSSHEGARYLPKEDGGRGFLFAGPELRRGGVWSMHIPDGYLSPSTCAVFGGVMLPIWARAAQKVRQTLKARQVPLLAMGAAFAFTIMMYNVPVIGGSSAHAVGGGLLAVILGPWAAVIAISTALAIQALLFGDGGILSFAVNSFNMAVTIPFVAYWIYRAVAGDSELTSPRRWIGGAIGGYIGINAAALFAGIELGLQPLLFHTAGGIPLYNPYPLRVSVPAMTLAHLLMAGPVEALVTGLVIYYLQRRDPSLLKIYPVQGPGPAAREAAAATVSRKLWWGLAVLMALSPLGLLASGTAFGEWDQSELQSRLGFIPQGIAKWGDLWKHKLFPDYSLPGFDQTFWQNAAVYIACAVVALAVLLGLTYLFRRVQLATQEKNKHVRGT